MWLCRVLLSGFGIGFGIGALCVRGACQCFCPRPTAGSQRAGAEEQFLRGIVNHIARADVQQAEAHRPRRLLVRFYILLTCGLSGAHTCYRGPLEDLHEVHHALVVAGVRAAEPACAIHVGALALDHVGQLERRVHQLSPRVVGERPQRRLRLRCTFIRKF